MQRHTARRRYNRDILIASAVYGASLILGSFWFRDHPGNAGVLAYAAALVPGLSIVAIFGVIGRYLVEEGDEYLRMLRIRQALIASAAALGLSTVWGSSKTTASPRTSPSSGSQSSGSRASRPARWSIA
ncbi:hypothetical protein ACFS32_08445 [Novosphingobium pokkalii]|uniref:hypothetical protein n=1 Tax=Novosphingobium pokkalii TaxID=1770194 RepID=UPI003625CED0